MEINYFMCICRYNYLILKRLLLWNFNCSCLLYSEIRIPGSDYALAFSAITILVKKECFTGFLYELIKKLFDSTVEFRTRFKTDSS